MNEQRAWTTAIFGLHCQAAGDVTAGVTLGGSALAKDAVLLRWLRRWRERDDQHLVKRAAALPPDPIDELCRIINEAQESDAEDERRLYRPTQGDRPSSAAEGFVPAQRV